MASAERKAIGGYSMWGVSVVLIFMLSLIVLSPEFADFTGLTFFPEETMIQHLTLPETEFRASDTPYTVSFPTEDIIKSVTASGTVYGDGKVKIVLRSGKEEWLVFERDTTAEMPPGGPITGMVTGNVTVPEENVTEPEENITVPGENATAQEENATEPAEETEANITEPEINVTEPPEEPEVNVTEPDENVTIEEPEPFANITINETQENVTIPEENITENVTEPETNLTIPEENITVPEENVTEELPPEENVTEENITEPPEEPEMNVTEANITEPETNVTEPATNVTVPEENVTIPEENVTLPEENITEENVTEPEENITEEIPEPEVFTFEDVCVDTCILPSVEMAELVVILEGNVTLELTSVKYNAVVVPEEEIPEKDEIYKIVEELGLIGESLTLRDVSIISGVKVTPEDEGYVLDMKLGYMRYPISLDEKMLKKLRPGVLDYMSRDPLTRVIVNVTQDAEFLTVGDFVERSNLKGKVKNLKTISAEQFRTEYSRLDIVHEKNIFLDSGDGTLFDVEQVGEGYVSVSVDTAGLEALLKSGVVKEVLPDKQFFASMFESALITETDYAYSSGYWGTGKSICVVDTG
jgi:hypothetical protein